MRDLRSEIQNKVLRGLNKLGTVNTPCVYQRRGDPTYVDGVSTPVVLSSDNVSVVMVDFNSSKSASTDLFPDGEPIRSIDKVAIFSTLLLPFNPSINDALVDADLVSWIIKGKTGDPAKAHWSLHVRPINE